LGTLIASVTVAHANVEKPIAMPPRPIKEDKLRCCKAELVILQLHKVVVRVEAGSFVNIDVNNRVFFVPQVA
jgi:hypothetical protein